MKALVLGGTAFLGIAVREALQERGHEVVLFNRGRRDPAPPGVRSVRGDRAHDLPRLGDEPFDWVVDTSGYFPGVVARSARFFAGRVKRYVFVSTISVYDEPLRPAHALSEESPLAALPAGAPRDAITAESYGPLKAQCESRVASILRQRATTVRPGLIVGPHDPTDRFTYWPLRYARGGDVLAPGPPETPVQFVDVRDLAAFIVKLLENNRSGVYNVTSPPGVITMGSLVRTCAEVARVPSRTVWADPAFLAAHHVEPWSDLPVWIPDGPGMLNTSVTRALREGLSLRPLRDTVRDTLAWARTRRRHQQRAGLTAQRERELLDALLR